TPFASPMRRAAHRGAGSLTTQTAPAARSRRDLPLSYVREREEELARCRDPQRNVLGEQPLVRGVDVRLAEREAGDHRRDPLVFERRHDRQRAAAPDQPRADAERALERVLPETDDGRIRRDEPRRRRREALQLDLRPWRSRLAQQPLEGVRDLGGLLTRGEPDRY